MCSDVTEIFQSVSDVSVIYLLYKLIIGARGGTVMRKKGREGAVPDPCDITKRKRTFDTHTHDGSQILIKRVRMFGIPSNSRTTLRAL